MIFSAKSKTQIREDLDTFVKIFAEPSLGC